MKNNSGGILIGILTGVAIGVGVGILFAPNKGSKTRKKLKNVAVDTKQDVSKWLTYAKDELDQTAHENKMAFDKKINNTIENMSHKAEDILKEMEHKLERLKKMNS